MPDDDGPLPMSHPDPLPVNHPDNPLGCPDMDPLPPDYDPLVPHTWEQQWWWEPGVGAVEVYHMDAERVRFRSAVQFWRTGRVRGPRCGPRWEEGLETMATSQFLKVFMPWIDSARDAHPSVGNDAYRKSAQYRVRFRGEIP
jgi:hypothetical protein